MYKIVMVSGFGYKKDFLTGFESERAAIKEAERRNWEYLDSNKFLWDLDVESIQI